MEIWEFLNQNPALFSVVAFPVGMALMVAVFRGFGISSLLKALQDHIAVETKIESRLTEIMGEMKDMLVTNQLAHQNNREFYSQKFEKVDTRFDGVEDSIKTVIQTILKCKEHLL